MSAPRQGANIGDTLVTFMKCVKCMKVCFKMKEIIDFNVSRNFQSI